MDIDHNDIINYKNHLQINNIIIPLIYTLGKNHTYDNIIQEKNINKYDQYIT